MKFKVDQLRKDKIIYATEACATVLVCLLGSFFSNEYFQSPLKDIINIFLLITGIAYTMFMGVGNFLRLREIQKIEKELYRAS